YRRQNGRWIQADKAADIALGEGPVRLERPDPEGKRLPGRTPGQESLQVGRQIPGTGFRPRWLQLDLREGLAGQVSLGTPLVRGKKPRSPGLAGKTGGITGLLQIILIAGHPFGPETFHDGCPLKGPDMAAG